MKVGVFAPLYLSRRANQACLPVAVLSAIDKYTLEKNYQERYFGAKVYKISRDPQGKRLTYLKITGGSLKTKESLSVPVEGGESLQEKVEEIRVYSGDKYKTLQYMGDLPKPLINQLYY